MRPLASVSLLILVLSSTTVVSAQRAGTGRALPPGEGSELVAAACSQCHGLGTIAAMRDGPAGWKVYVYDMILRGAMLNPSEAETVIGYLSEHLGPSQAQAQPAERASSSLPAGPGMELVLSKCSMCHDLGRVIAPKRKSADWDAVLADMKNRGAAVTAEDLRTIRSYLVAHFELKSE